MQIEPFFKDTLFCDATALSLEQFMCSFPRRDTEPQNGYFMNTINLVMKVIIKAIKEAMRLGIFPRDPSGRIEIVSEDTEERGILTPDETEEVKEPPTSFLQHTRNNAMVRRTQSSTHLKSSALAWKKTFIYYEKSAKK
jgi:hypothetical protein